MHEIKAIYKENECKAQIDGKPYILINFEEYWKTKVKKHSPHCDFIYIQIKENKYKVFLVELKGVKSKNEESAEDTLLEIIKKALDKFLPTLQEVSDNIAPSFDVRNNADYFCILVLPEETLTRIPALLRRLKSHTTSKIKPIKGVKKDIKCWIALSEKNITEQFFYLA